MSSRKSKKRKRSKQQKIWKWIVLGVILGAVLFPVVLLLVIHIIMMWMPDQTRDENLSKEPSAYDTVDEKGVFHIYNEGDWMAFLSYVNKGYESLDAVLEEDVVVERSKYAVRDHSYAGHFDGQGHKMKLSARRCSMFSILEVEGVIENLTLEVTVSSIQGEGSGGIVRYNYGTIRNCNVYGTVVSYDYVGGIAEANLGLIENCSNHADVTSLETGETWKDEDYLICGYGAGGIAGLSASSVREDDVPENCAIVNCSNYGDVTAEVYAGGITARVEDRTNGGAPVSSVQELVQYEDFITPSEAALPEDEESALQREEDADQHYSLSGCTNYGTVTVNQRKDPRTLWYTQAAGICADLHRGDIYRCVNRGKVQFAESVPRYTESGAGHTSRPVAIVPNMGFAPTAEHHIIECASLKGTIEGKMRFENILELSEEELSAWEAGTYTEEYISNNWEFDLEEAVDVSRLEPLGVRESAVSAGRKNYYLCEEFALFLPDFLEIQEVCLPSQEGSACYALHIQVCGGIEEETFPGIDEEEECWILCKSADVEEALREAKESNTRDEWRVRYFMEELYRTITPYYNLKISSMSLPFHDSFQDRYMDGKRIFMESVMPGKNYMKEGDHVLGNMIAMPLQGASKQWEEGDISAKWIFVFTRRETNIHPSMAFINLIEESFYPFDRGEEVYTVREGDSLWELAGERTGDAGNWKLLADINGMEEPDLVFAGDTLILPSRERWEERVEVLTSEWICAYGETAKEDGFEE